MSLSVVLEEAQAAPADTRSSELICTWTVNGLIGCQHRWYRSHTGDHTHKRARAWRQGCTSLWQTVSGQQRVTNTCEIVDDLFQPVYPATTGEHAASCIEYFCRPEILQHFSFDNFLHIYFLLPCLFCFSWCSIVWLQHCLSVVLNAKYKITLTLHV